MQEKANKKIDAKFLANKKMEKIYESINQTLNGLADEWILKKYYAYLKSNGIQIQTNIFERMDLDRRIIESLRKL